MMYDWKSVCLSKDLPFLTYKYLIAYNIFCKCYNLLKAGYAPTAEQGSNCNSKLYTVI